MADGAASSAVTPAPPAADKADDRLARLQSRGRLRVDLRTAENVKAGKWHVLARVGVMSVEVELVTRDKRTEWAPGKAGGVLGDGVQLMHVINQPLEVTVWSIDKGTMRTVRPRAPSASAASACASYNM